MNERKREERESRGSHYAGSPLYVRRFPSRETYMRDRCPARYTYSSIRKEDESVSFCITNRALSSPSFGFRRSIATTKGPSDRPTAIKDTIGYSHRPKNVADWARIRTQREHQVSRASATGSCSLANRLALATLHTQLDRVKVYNWFE